MTRYLDATEQLAAMHEPRLGGIKHDTSKLPLELLPFEALESIAEVLKFGATKYEAHNWRKGFKWSRLLGASLRHLFAWARGEGKDPETGYSHLAHAGCCVLFLLAHEINNYGEDDSWTPTIKP